MSTTQVERLVSGHAPRCLVEIPVASATVISKGDFVLLYQGNAIPPSLLGSIYSSATVARREGFMMFGGIARNSSRSGDTDPIQIDISADSQYHLQQCSAGALSVPDLLGICAVSNASNLWGLEDQKVSADCSYPIAVTLKAKGATGTRIIARLLHTKLFMPQGSYNICDGDSALSYAG